MQILFPEPQLHKLRQISKKKDRPVSELIRLAVDYWLSRQGEAFGGEGTPPVYSCGKILVHPEELRELAYNMSEET